MFVFVTVKICLFVKIDCFCYFICFAERSASFNIAIFETFMKVWLNLDYNTRVMLVQFNVKLKEIQILILHTSDTIEPLRN